MKLSAGTPVTRPDGAEWHEFELEDCGAKATLTSRGRELFEARPGLGELLEEYISRALGKSALTGDNIRNFFDEGTNSKIYTLGDDLLVKETHAHSMVDALDRMDRIATAVEKHAPRWIDVPNYYGLLRGRRFPDDYVLMQRIDAGINVHHLTQQHELPELERRGIEREFGPITDQDRVDIATRFDLAKQHLDQAVANEDLIPGDYLTDWSTENVLVERLRTPVAASPYRLWVIDQ